MKKKDLKDWMLVQTRSMGTYMHIGGKLYNRSEWNDLGDYNDDLEICVKPSRWFDIMKVSRELPTCNRAPDNWTEPVLADNLLWERDERGVSIDNKNKGWPDKCAVRYRDLGHAVWGYGFWDSHNRAPFSFSGKRGGSKWAIVERLEEEPEHLSDLRRYLED